MLQQTLPVSIHTSLGTNTALFNKYASMPPYLHHTLVKSFVLDSITQLEPLEILEQNSTDIAPPTLSRIISTDLQMEQQFKSAFGLVKVIRDRVFRITMKYFLRFVAFHMHPVMQDNEKRAFWRQLFEFYYLNETAIAWRQHGGSDIFGFTEALHFLKNSHFQDLFSYWLLKQFFSRPHHASSSFVQLFDWVQKFSELIWAQEQPLINEHTLRQFTDEECQSLNLTLHISKDDEALFVAYFEEINWSVQMEPLPLNFNDLLHQRDFIFSQNPMCSPLSNIETATSRFLTSAVESENEVGDIKQQIEEEGVISMIDELEKDIDMVVFSKLNP